MLVFTHFQSIINGQKHLYNQSSHYGNTKHSIIKVYASVINLHVGVLSDHGVSLPFISLTALQTLWVTFQAKKMM